MDPFLVASNLCLFVINAALGCWVTYSGYRRTIRQQEVAVQPHPAVIKQQGYEVLMTIAIIWLILIVAQLNCFPGLTNGQWAVTVCPAALGWTWVYLAIIWPASTRNNVVRIRAEPGMTHLPALPRNATELVIEEGEDLVELPILPRNLTTLRVYYCPALTSLPALPRSITRLEIDSCQALSRLPRLPGGLKELDLMDAPALTSLPQLPDRLSLLRLINCAGLKNLATGLPKTVTALEIINCPHLRRRVYIVGMLRVRFN